MKTPIAIICGPAGSGKDSLAARLAHHTQGICIAMADPMKRLAKVVFDFSDETLWGPSSCRNAEDPRYDSIHAWDVAGQRLRGYGLQWIQDILPGLSKADQLIAERALRQWFLDIAQAHGFICQAPGFFPPITSGDLERIEPFVAQAREIRRTITCRWVLQTLGTEFGRSFSPNMWVDYATRTALQLLAGGYSYDRALGLQRVGANQVDTSKRPGYVFITDGRFTNEVLKIKTLGGTTILVQAPVVETLDAGVKGHVSEAELKTIPEHFFDIQFENDKQYGLEALDDAAKQLTRHLTREGSSMPRPPGPKRR